MPRPLAGALVSLLALLAAACDVASGGSSAQLVPPGGPLPLTAEREPGDEPDLDAPPVALAPPGGAIVEADVVRIPKPKIDLDGQRRVGIQVGHLRTDTVPTEYGPRIQAQTGASWEGVAEVDLTTEVADRMAALLRAQGVAVDLIPTTVPEGYLADGFVALHADSDGVGERSGFKLAHSARRGPYEDALLAGLKAAYARATGLAYDAEHISPAMRFYYAFNWGRYRHATSPFTPSSIIELGFLSNDDDRAFLTAHADVAAGALASAVLQFLDDHPRAKLFASDLVLPRAPPRRSASPTPSATP